MRKIENIVGIVAAIFIVWVFASWIDVITHNIDTSPMYAAWNFFTIIF